MEFVWATKDLVIDGRPYPGFPILLWDTMESCVPANDFFRHYILRGVIGSQKSWPSTGPTGHALCPAIQLDASTAPPCIWQFRCLLAGAASRPSLRHSTACWRPTRAGSPSSMPHRVEHGGSAVSGYAAAPCACGNRTGDLQHTTDRLDPETVAMLVNKCPQDLLRRRKACPSGSAWAKYALARCRISLSLRNSRFSRSNALIRSRSSVVGPGRWSASVCWRQIQQCRVCAAQPIFGAMASIAAHSEGWSFKCSKPCARHVHGLQGSRS